MDPRTKALIEAPIVPTLIRLAIPNIVTTVVQASTGLIETYYIGKLGTDALGGIGQRGVVGQVHDVRRHRNATAGTDVGRHRLQPIGVPVDQGQRDGEDFRPGGLDVLAHRREVGMVFQQFNLFPQMTALQNVMFGPIHTRGQGRDDRLGVIAAVAFVDPGGRLGEGADPAVPGDLEVQPRGLQGRGRTLFAHAPTIVRTPAPAGPR